MASGDKVDVVRNYRRVEDGHVIRVKIMRVPTSEKFPNGVKYRLHFGTLDGECVVRYDNSHGVHERHVGDDVTRIDFPGIDALLDRFEREVVERLSRADHGNGGTHQ